MTEWSTFVITNSLNSTNQYFGRGEPLKVVSSPKQLCFKTVLEVVKMYLQILKIFLLQFVEILLYFTNKTRIVIGA